MRIIFLEFDGVLHPRDEGHLPDGRLRWLSTLEVLLHSAPDVRLVVHSSWRYSFNDEELRALLGSLSSRFFGSAPRGPREQAIGMILQENKATVRSHLVLDYDPTEFSLGRLNTQFCDPYLGLSERRTQAALFTWLQRTAPERGSAPGIRLPMGYGELVLYLDYDGVLHHENVLLHHRRGAYAGAPGFQLFEHASLLAELLAPYPQVRIVLSTSWVRTYGCYRSAKRLPLALRERVIGATFHSAMNETAFVNKRRGQQVIEDVARRQPRSWLAIDDTDEGWPLEFREQVILTDECLGISAPGLAGQIAQRLMFMASLQG